MSSNEVDRLFLQTISVSTSGCVCVGGGGGGGGEYSDIFTHT